MGVLLLMLSDNYGWFFDRFFCANALTANHANFTPQQLVDFSYMPRGTNGALHHGVLYNAK